MSRWKHFKARYGGYRKKYGGRVSGIMGASMPYVAGFVIGMTNYDKQIPAVLKLGVACAPYGLMRGGLGTVQKLAQGMVLGDLVQVKTGFTLGGNGSSMSIGGV